MQNSPDRARLLLFYGLMVAGSVLLYFVIRSFGDRLVAPVLPAGSSLGAAPISAQGGTLFHVLIVLLVIIAASRGVGAVFRFFHQPPVIGEVLAGILLGPSLLGKVAPTVMASVFPSSVIPLVGIIAQIGVLLFMFVVGLEL